MLKPPQEIQAGSRKSIDQQLAELEEREINTREAMEQGVDPAFVMQSLERLQQHRAELESKRADLKNAGRILSLTDDDIANICCSIGSYLEDLEGALATGDPEKKRKFLLSVVDRVTVDRPGNLASVYIRAIPSLAGVESFTKNIDKTSLFC